MGIYIVLRANPEYSPRDHALNRLGYCIKAIQFFSEGKIFSVENTEIWKGSPSKSLGGELLRRFEDTNLFVTQKTIEERLRRMPYEDLLNSVIVFNGFWEISGQRLAGFFSIQNNRRLRGVYRDIEIDAYGKGEAEDIVDAMWKMEEKSGIITSFIAKLKHDLANTPMWIYEVFFSKGIPVPGQIDNIRAIHLATDKDMLRFLYTVLENDPDPRISSKVIPVRSRFFINTLIGENIVTSRLQESLNTALIEKHIGQSTTYIAKEDKSFSNLYDEFADKVFKQALINLPRDIEVEGKIRRGLKGEQDLTQFSVEENVSRAIPVTLLMGFFKDATGKYRFRLLKHDGEIIAISEPYDSLEKCREGIELLKGRLNLIEQE